MNRESRNVTVAALLVAGLAMPGPGTNTPSAPAPAPVFLAQAGSEPEIAAPTERTRASDEKLEAAPPEPQEKQESVMRSGVPEGFEAYMAPQKTLVDVYFGDRFITSAMAEYTPDSIEFLNPEKVIRNLPNVTARPVLLNHFRGPLPTHSDRVCRNDNQQDCGTLDPAFIGVIFNERRFRADIFVHQELMAPAETRRARYLEKPDATRAGLVQNLNLNHAGSSTGDDRFSVFGRTRAGRGTQHLFSSWVSTEEQGLSVDELGLRKDFPDHELNVGLFEPENGLLTILRRQPIAGVGLKRSFKRRQDLESTFASDVQVFLTSRSRVELYKDGRLYDVSYYEAGNRTLDTARLPGGAYNLEIQITDSGGRSRTLERFFVKSRRLAPAGELLWFSNLGRAYLRDPQSEFPEDAGTLLATGGAQYRYREKIGVGVAGAAIEDAGLLEASADWLTPGAQAFASLFASTEGGAGWLVRGTFSYEDMRLIMDSQRVWAEAPDPGSEYVLLPNELERDSVEARLPATGGQYFASWRRLERENEAEQRISTLGFTRTFQVGAQQSINLSTSVSRVNDSNRGLISLDWRQSSRQWQNQARVAWQESDAAFDDSGASARAATTWQDLETFVDEVQVTASAEADDTNSTASLSAQHTWQYGRGRAAVSHSERDQAPGRQLTSASYDTNILASRRGLAVGGPELNEAGIIIDLEGADGALFDVLVDGKKRFVARGGRRAALTLPGYDTYHVSIRDRGTDFVHYDNSSREVTLYPGNVITLDWSLERITIILGTLVKPDGSPLGDVIINGTRGVTTTDPDGYFQGEIRGHQRALHATLHGERCNLELGTLKVKNGVARLGEVTCRPAAAAPARDEGAEAGPDATRQ